MTDDQRKPSHTVGPGFFASSAGAISDPTEPTETHHVAPAADAAAPPTALTDSEGGFSNPGVTDYSGRMVGPYKLIEVIGQGGMGQVYLAEHVRLGRRVALKMLRPQYARDVEAVKRFFGEAKSVNQISHDHIIEITDFIEAEGQPASFIMEYLEGQTLADVVNRHGRLTPERLIAIASQITGAMAAVHDAFMIHRDLKPENIFLTTRNGRTDYVKLLDFGVAKLTEHKAITEDTAQTQAGVILGTPDYMAPEQFDAATLDHRTDIYALGVILYEMATGKKPFEETSIGRLAVATLTKTPIRPLHTEDAPHIPQQLDALIMQCLEKSPDRRPQHMANIEEILAAISRDLVSGVAVFGAPTRDDIEVFKPKSRAPRWAAALGAVCLLGAGAAYYLASPSSASEAVPVVAATPETVDLAVASTPDGAEVFLGEVRLGTTPLKATMPYESAYGVLRVVAEGYAPVSHNVRLDAPVALSVALHKNAEDAVVTETAPAKARRKTSARSRTKASRADDKRAAEAKKAADDANAAKAADKLADDNAAAANARGRDVPTKSNVIIKKKKRAKKKAKTREDLLDPFAP